MTRRVKHMPKGRGPAPAGWLRMRQIATQRRPSNDLGPILRATLGALMLLSMLVGCTTKAPATQPAAAPAGPSQTSPVASPEELPIKGSAEAPAVLVVFCDFV